MFAIDRLVKHEALHGGGLLRLARRLLLVLADFQRYANAGQGGVHFRRKQAPLPIFRLEVRR